MHAHSLNLTLRMNIIYLQNIIMNLLFEETCHCTLMINDYCPHRHSASQGGETQLLKEELPTS